MPLHFLSPRHPLWGAGFRPFFMLAIFMGFLLPAIWGLVFSGRLVLPAGINSIQWHMHEMLFGFSGAVLIGFLLTASKNWVKVRGIHGTALMILVGLWIFERVFIYFASDFGPIVEHLGLSLFTAASGFYIVFTLLRHRRNDSFNDNYFFIIFLSVLLVSKNLLIAESYYRYGITMTLGLFRLAFVLMFERTMPQFMKNTEEQVLYRNKILDFMIKFTVLLAVFENFYPPKITIAIFMLAAVLLLVRWVLWRPDIGFRKFGNATMYTGYLALIIHFAFAVLQIAEVWSSGTTALHIFTLLCIGLVVPSMLVRISQGHTGRKPQFFTSDKIAIGFIFISAFVRLLLPVIFPAEYSTWVMVAGLLWSAAFLILGIRLIPLLFQARIDGKEH